MRSHVGLDPPINGKDYLYRYEDKIIESDCNFVREDIIDVEKWGDVVVVHTDKLHKAGITIQYTLADANVDGYGDYKKAIELLKDYPIIWEAENEFLDEEIHAGQAILICKDIDDKGLVSSCGAWGNSTHGESLAKQFLESYQPQIITMHRPYPPIWEYEAWIKYLKGFGRPIIQNEFLLGGSALIESYARIGFKLGLRGFNVYGGDGGIEYLGVMGKICKDVNA